MKEKLLQFFEELSPDHQQQLLDYAQMLWEMNQSEKDLRQQMGIPETVEEKVHKLNPNFMNPQDDEVN